MTKEYTPLLEQMAKLVGVYYVDRVEASAPSAE
jgi:hypothetical protein